MPAFTQKDKPDDYNTLVSTPGAAWLKENPNHEGRPRALWNQKPIKKKLRKNFSSLCGYTLMHEMRGSVDHYISWDTDPSKAYDWDNYRFCAGSVNSSKKTADTTVFDPYDIEFEWFEIHLPSMIMKVGANAPAHLRVKLEFSLQRLPIADTDEVIDYRAEYYQGYKDGEMTIAWLRKKAPILAASIESWERSNPLTPLP